VLLSTLEIKKQALLWMWRKRGWRGISTWWFYLGRAFLFGDLYIVLCWFL